MKEPIAAYDATAKREQVVEQRREQKMGWQSSLSPESVRTVIVTFGAAMLTFHRHGILCRKPDTHCRRT
jgi:hypothetical protein